MLEPPSWTVRFVCHTSSLQCLAQCEHLSTGIRGRDKETRREIERPVDSKDSKSGRDIEKTGKCVLCVRPLSVTFLLPSHCNNNATRTDLSASSISDASTSKTIPFRHLNPLHKIRHTHIGHNTNQTSQHAAVYSSMRLSLSVDKGEDGEEVDGRIGLCSRREHTTTSIQLIYVHYIACCGPMRGFNLTNHPD